MKTQLSKPNEHKIMDSIQDLLRYNGYLVWRNNVGGRPWTDKYGRKKYVKFGQPGHSDLFAIQRGTGKFCAFEIKRPETRKTATPAQLDFINQVKEQGGIAAVVCSAEECAAILGIKGLL